MVLLFALNAALAETDVPCHPPATQDVGVVPPNGAVDVPLDVVFSAGATTSPCYDWTFRLSHDGQLVYEEPRYEGLFAQSRPLSPLLPDALYELEIEGPDPEPVVVTFHTGSGSAAPIAGLPRAENVTATWYGRSDRVEICADVVAAEAPFSLVGIRDATYDDVWGVGARTMCHGWSERSAPDEACLRAVQWGADGVQVTGERACVAVAVVDDLAPGDEAEGRGGCGSRGVVLLLLALPRRRR